MRTMTRKLAALVMAVAMIVSLAAFAQAEQPAQVQTVPAALARGANLQLNLDVQLSKDMLLPMLSGALGGDEEEMAMVSAAMDAVNKLKTTVLYSLNALSGRIGTDTGDLITLQGSINPETLENTFTTSLLPDVKLSLDQAMMEKAMGGMPINPKQPMTAAEAQAMILPYTQAITTFFSEQVMPNATPEQGPFAVEGVATFENRVTVPVTTHGVAQLLNSVLTVFKSDAKMQQMLAESMKASELSMEAASGGDAAAAPSAADAVKKMEEGIADLMSKADEAIATVRYYASPADAAAPVYLEIEGVPAAQRPMFATAVIKPQGNDVDVAVALLINTQAAAADISEFTSEEQVVTSPAPEGAATDAPAAASDAPAAPELAPTDWAALHSAVLNGENTTATLVNLKFSTKTTESAMNGTFAFDIRTPMAGMGMMYMGLGLDSQAMLGDKVEQSGTLTISALSPAPLVTVHFSLAETEEQPAAPMEAGKSLALSENTSEDAMQEALAQPLMTGVKAMLENLKTVLPEEAGVLNMTLKDLLPSTEDAPAANP